MRMNNIITEAPDNKVSDLEPKQYGATQTHTVGDLVKGFIQDEVKNKNRQQGMHGDQGADSESLKKYLLHLGYPEEKVDEFVSSKTSAAPSLEPQSKEAEPSRDLTPKQQTDLQRVQQFIQSGKMTKKQVTLLARDLMR